jgi:Glycoside hydrolase 123, N-terminal domain
VTRNSIMYFRLMAATFLLLALTYSQGMEEVPYGIGSWKENLGNHRARIEVKEKADAVRLHLVWRRCDPSPKAKGVLIYNASADEAVDNVAIVGFSHDYGDIIFKADAPGEYYVYYMPYQPERRPGFRFGRYLPPRSCTDTAWFQRNEIDTELMTLEAWEQLPKAKVLEIQARSEFHSFYPMEVVAAAYEVEHILSNNPNQPYLLFPEDRKYPIRMKHRLPLRWIKKGPSTQFTGTAQPNEYYAFQIGVYAAQQQIDDLPIVFEELHSDGGSAIQASAFNCYNLGGKDWAGRSFKKTFTVSKGDVGALWIGVQIPPDARAGTYQGKLTLKPKSAPPSTINLKLEVSGEALSDHGDSEPWRHSRMRWLDSTLAIDDGLVAPYTPLEQDGETISCLGRSVKIGMNGLPESIKCGAREVLVQPIALVIETTDGNAEWTRLDSKTIKNTPASIAWQTRSKTDGFLLTSRAAMEFDGFLHFQLELTATTATSVKDIRLEIPISKEVARYMMGMGKKGGNRPNKWEWKWNQKNHQDSIWIGDYDAGLQCKLKGPNYRRPLVVHNYPRQPLLLPVDWHNDGQGGCRVTEQGANMVLLQPYSGERNIEAGQTLRFDFDLLITPVKPINYKAHWKNRYFHTYARPVDIDDVASKGATVLNIHHADTINPFINYPFLRPDEMSAYVKKAHEADLKLKIYYTVREISNYATELWMLRSLGDEIVADGPGGGYSWLSEHMRTNYKSNWYHHYKDGSVDAAFVTTGLSRMHNYYLEGLKWLLENMEIDGIYIDDAVFDRSILQRIRKVLDRTRPGCMIDFHSWNHFFKKSGYANCANLYMELFPYIDRLWFGESFKSSEPPDYWLVEISGIPYGMMGDMLDANNRWRGMLYGMVVRMPWRGDSRPLWKVWDDFGIEESKMLGYWQPDCPVRTDNENVLATVYRKEGKTLISIASWAKEPVECKLTIDWKALGLNPNTSVLTAPEVKNFQQAAQFKPTDPIPVEAERGWLLLLGE